MTLLAPSAPLLTVAHDWSAPVERVTTYPSRLIQKWDGSTQGLSLSHLPTHRLTYRLIAADANEAVSLNVLAKLADDALVRIPRWEDQARITVAASGDTIAGEFADRPAFVVGNEVIFWRSPASYEVGVLATVTDAEITLEDALASTWAAGTIVAPVSEARVVFPLSLSHWAPTSGIPQLTVDVGLRDLAGLGSGGAAVAGTPTAITITGGGPQKNGVPNAQPNGRAFIVAVVTDAVGNVLVRDDIVWTSADPTNCPVWASGEPGVAIFANPTPVDDTGSTITATLGALSDAQIVGLG